MLPAVKMSFFQKNRTDASVICAALSNIDESLDQSDDAGWQWLEFEVVAGVVVANILYDFAGPFHIRW
jgi:hypothetical protein